MEYTFFSNSSEETEIFGKTLGQSLRGLYGLIYLIGDLGAGKTALTRGIVRGFGIDDYVTSPTFTLMNSYGNPTSIYHLDLYRLSDIDELYEIGFDEIAASKLPIVIEWPQMLMEEDLKPLAVVYLDRTEGDPNERKITLSTDNPLLIKRLKIE